MPEFRRACDEAWSQALLSLNAAEHEAEKVVARVAGLAGFTADEVRTHAAALAGLLRQQRLDLDRAIRDAIDRAMRQIPALPTKADLEHLRSSVAALAERVAALEARKNGGGR